MKVYIITLLLLLQVIGFMGCTKDSGDSQSAGSTGTLPPIGPLPNQLPHSNTAPIANAGPDLTLTLPIDEITLPGSFTDAENDVKEVYWTKISGPASYSFDNRFSATSVLRQLKRGVYWLVLTVVDSLNNIDKDTTTLTVKSDPAPTGERLFNEIEWISPWYNSLTIPDIHNYINPGSQLKVFVQRGNSPIWLEATHISNSRSGNPYEYFIESRLDGAGMYTTGSLYVFYYGTDVSDTPNVKIVF